MAERDFESKPGREEGLVDLYNSKYDAKYLISLKMYLCATAAQDFDALDLVQLETTEGRAHDLRYFIVPI